MKIDVAALQTQFGVSTEKLAVATERPISVIQDWHTAQGSAPTYIALTIDAVSRDLAPAAPHVMMKADLNALIGISKGTENFWKNAKQFPVAACLAAAAVIHPVETLGPYDLDLLKRVNEAKHFRARNGWRARPVLGRPYPTIRAKTPLRLMVAGLVHITGQPAYLALTDKGKARLYGKANHT